MKFAKDTKLACQFSYYLLKLFKKNQIIQKKELSVSYYFLKLAFKCAFNFMVVGNGKEKAERERERSRKRRTKKKEK